MDPECIRQGLLSPPLTQHERWADAVADEAQARSPAGDLDVEMMLYEAIKTFADKYRFSFNEAIEVIATTISDDS